MGRWTIQALQDPTAAPQPRGGHSSVAVGDRLVCFGGADRTPMPYADIWVFHRRDPAGSQWVWTKVHPISITGEELLPRVGASLSLVNDTIYLFGGQDPRTGDCYGDLISIDTRTWKWSPVDVPGVRPPSRHSHCAGVASKRSLVIFGGASSTSVLGDLWLFDTYTRIWSHPKTKGNAAGPREMHIGQMVGENELLIYGGRSPTGQVLDDAAVVDVVQLEWKRGASTSYPRCSHASTAAPTWWVEGRDAPGESGHQTQADVRVLIFGGFSGSVEDSFLSIDPATLTAKELDAEPESINDAKVASRSRPAARFAHAMETAFIGTSELEVMIYGGVNTAQDLNDVVFWHPDPATTTHKEQPPAAGQLPTSEQLLTAEQLPNPNQSTAAAAPTTHSPQATPPAIHPGPSATAEPRQDIPDAGATSQPHILPSSGAPQPSAQPPPASPALQDPGAAGASAALQP